MKKVVTIDFDIIMHPSIEVYNDSDMSVDEYEAIEGYTSAIATARAEGYEDVAKVLEDISAEESVHVGQLQEVMKLFDPGAVNVDDGAAEAAEQLNNLDDEI